MDWCLRSVGSVCGVYLAYIDFIDFVITPVDGRCGHSAFSESAGAGGKAEEREGERERRRREEGKQEGTPGFDSGAFEEIIFG